MVLEYLDISSCDVTSLSGNLFYSLKTFKASNNSLSGNFELSQIPKI